MAVVGFDNLSAPQAEVVGPSFEPVGVADRCHPAPKRLALQLAVEAVA